MAEKRGCLERLAARVFLIRGAAPRRPGGRLTPGYLKQGNFRGTVKGRYRVGTR